MRSRTWPLLVSVLLLAWPAAAQEQPSAALAAVEKVDEAKLEALARPAESVAAAAAAVEPQKPVDLSEADEKLTTLLGKPK